MFQRESDPVRRPRGRAIAAGVLCAVAATIALWSGPLKAASGALHSGADAGASVVSVPHTAK
jgi:ferric-dicitrate binding protein FerR (iron transport regulator)